MILRSQRLRILSGVIEPGDAEALRRFVRLSEAEFAAALGIDVDTLRTWKRDGVDGTGPRSPPHCGS